MKFALSYVFWALEWVSYALLASLTFALDVDIPPTGEPIFLQDAVEFAHEYSTRLGVGLVVAIPVTKLLQWLVREKSREQLILDDQACKALNHFRKKVFPALPPNVQVHKNRVTLFKKVGTMWFLQSGRGCLLWPWGKWGCPWSGWLVVAHRSGHVTLDSKMAFYAPNSGNAEGIAGAAYQAEEAIRAKNLPSIRSDEYVGWLTGLWLQIRHNASFPCASSNNYLDLKERVHLYASQTFTTPRMVWKRLKSGKSLPTDILGIKLEKENGKVWGAIVMDSSNSHVCVDTTTKTFKDAWKELNHQLELCGALS